VRDSSIFNRPDQMMTKISGNKYKWKEPWPGPGDDPYDDYVVADYPTMSPVYSSGETPTSSPVTLPATGMPVMATTVSPTLQPVVDSSVTSPTVTTAPVVDASNTTEAPTTSPVAAIDLRPPDEDEATLLTTVPTQSPTAEAVESVETRLVQSNALTFRASGTTSLGSVEVKFFEHVERLMQPYAASQVGPALTKFLLSIVFQHDKEEVSTIGATGQNSLHRSVFQMSQLFNLEGAGEEVSVFTKAEATQIVSSFFQGTMLNRLLEALAQDGIHISHIGEYDPEDDTTSNPEDGDIDGDVPPAENDGLQPPNDPNSDKNNSRSVVLVTLFSGSIVILALGAAMLINTRRRRRFYYYGEKVAQASSMSESYAMHESSSEENSDSGGSRIPKAALAQKSYDSRDFLRNHANVSSGLEPMVPTTNDEPTYFNEEEKTEIEELDALERAATMPYSDEPAAVAGALLTCLDGEGAVGNMDRNYPEFEMFSNLEQPLSPQTDYSPEPGSPESPYVQGGSPPGHYVNSEDPQSPYWSVDGGLSSNPDDEDYQSDRRRWQDEANDIGLVALPDHASSMDGSESENGWSTDETEPGIQVLRSLD
jgi:hypothetical protein